MPATPATRETSIAYIRASLAEAPEDHTILLLRRGRHKYSFHRYVPTEGAQWMDDITKHVGMLTNHTVHDEDCYFWFIRTSDPQGLVSQLGIEMGGNHYDLRYEFI
jgi:hypothetical protein